MVSQKTSEKISLGENFKKEEAFHSACSSWKIGREEP